MSYIKRWLFAESLLFIILALFQEPTALALAAWGQGDPLLPQQQLARNIFKELIEINTTPSSGNTTVAAEAVAARLRAAGVRYSPFSRPKISEIKVVRCRSNFQAVSR